MMEQRTDIHTTTNTAYIIIKKLSEHKL